MTPEEIIELARQARLHRNQHNLASNPVQYRFTYDGTEGALIAFAKLVAEKEREACAKLCHNVSVKANYSVESEYHSGRWRGSQECYEAIRARNKHEN